MLKGEISNRSIIGSIAECFLLKDQQMQRTLSLVFMEHFIRDFECSNSNPQMVTASLVFLSREFLFKKSQLQKMDLNILGFDAKKIRIFLTDFLRRQKSLKQFIQDTLQTLDYFLSQISEKKTST